jgi:hypothetical protein
MEKIEIGFITKSSSYLLCSLYPALSWKSIGTEQVPAELKKYLYLRLVLVKMMVRGKPALSASAPQEETHPLPYIFDIIEPGIDGLRSGTPTS